MGERTLILEKVAHARSPGKDKLGYIFDNLGLVSGRQRSEPLGKALFNLVSLGNSRSMIFAIMFDEPLCLGGTVESSICGHLSVHGGDRFGLRAKGGSGTYWTAIVLEAYASPSLRRDGACLRAGRENGGRKVTRLCLLFCGLWCGGVHLLILEPE